MTNQQILETAMKQSAADSGCNWQDFKEKQNKIVISKKNKEARKYLKLPFICDLTSYGTNIVASVSEDLEEITREYINKYKAEHCFETPNLHELIDKIRPSGYNVCFMAEYSLPDAGILLRENLADQLQEKLCKKAGGTSYEIRIMGHEDFKGLYTEEWGNALCKERKELDIIGAGAFYNGKLAGLAGASADCKTMWQIGIDVLPGHRRRGVAAALTSRLATEILKKGIVPFYCCAWSNIASIRNAIKSGFYPAWVQLTVKTEEEILEMNMVE